MGASVVGGKTPVEEEILPLRRKTTELAPDIVRYAPANSRSFNRVRRSDPPGSRTQDVCLQYIINERN